jgi:AcrR family transcriptional regulator
MNDRSQAIRVALLDAAGDLLSERGVSAVTAREIARRAGLSDGVLYNYFEDKSELVLDALVGAFERLAAEFEGDLPEPGTGSVSENVHQLARALLRFHQRSLPMIGSVVADPPLLRSFMTEIHRPHQYPERIRKPIVAYLRAEQQRKRIGPESVESAADLLIGGTAILALNGARGRRRLRELTATLIHGLEVTK